MKPRVICFRGLGIFGFLAIVLMTLSFFVYNPSVSFAASWQQESSAESEQREAPSKNVPRVSLGNITGSPGASLMVPLYYTAAPNLPLRSIAVELDYVGNHLKFQKASRGTIAEKVGADVSTTLTEGAPDGKGLIQSKVRIDVALVEKEPQEGIPEGLLAFLLFRVTPDAKPFAIRLNTSVTLAEDLQNPPKKVAQVASESGLVVVQLADVIPEATCFFFTH